MGGISILFFAKLKSVRAPTKSISSFSHHFVRRVKFLIHQLGPLPKKCIQLALCYNGGNRSAIESILQEPDISLVQASQVRFRRSVRRKFFLLFREFWRRSSQA